MKLTKSIRNAVLLGIACVFASASFASEKEVDLVTFTKEGGNFFNENIILKEALEEKGWKVNIVSTGNCVNKLKHLAQSSNPSIVLYADGTYVARKKLGCEMQITDQALVAPVSAGTRVMCVRADDPAKNLVEFFTSRDEVSVARSNTTPLLYVTDLGNVLNKKVKDVVYNGSGNAFKGLLAGDVDAVFNGLTKREAKSDKVKCLAQWGKTTTAGIATVQSQVSGLEHPLSWSYRFIMGANLSDDTKSMIAKDILDATKTSDTLSNYINSASAVPGYELTEFNAKTVLDAAAMIE